MGQAKNRGTYEQRVEQSKARQAAELKASGERMEVERKAEREALIAARMAGHDVVVTGRNRRQSMALAAILGMAAIGRLGDK